MNDDAGHHAEQCWNDIPIHFPHMALDVCVVMPNHLHGIIVITGTVGAKKVSPLHSASNARQFQSPSKTIGSIIRGFKIGVTKWFGHPVWQRNYYEHIIRSEEEMNRIREYIIANPAKWDDDENNPGNIVFCRGEKSFSPAS